MSAESFSFAPAAGKCPIHICFTSHLRRVVQARTYARTTRLLGELHFAVFWFTLFVCLGAIGTGLLVPLVGVPLFALTLDVARWVARSGGEWALMPGDARARPSPLSASQGGMREATAP